MSPSSDYFSLETRQTAQIVSFKRDIHNADAIELIHAQIRQLIDAASQPRLVLDFAHLRNIGSNFLGMVMGISMQATRKEGQVRVCNMTPEIRDLFNLTRLDKIVPVHASVDDAVASFH